jgi:hypothetical protein
MPVLPPRRPPAPMRTLHCDTTLARPPTLLSRLSRPDTTLPCAALPRFATLATATACTHAILDAHSLPRAPLPPHRAAVASRVPSSPSRPPPRPRHDRTPTHRAPILSPRTTPRTSLCSTTVLALDHARLSRPPSFDHRPRPRPRHDRTTAPPLSSPPPPSSRSAPRHPFYGPVPRPRDARPDSDATTRALQRHAAPDHRTPRATRSRRASSPTTASSSSSLRSSPLHARMRSRPPSTITITTRSTHLSALSRTLSRNIAGLTRRSSRCHMSEICTVAAFCLCLSIFLGP